MIFINRGEEGVGREGKTTTALGVQVWLRRAARGETVTPMFERWGVVREKELETNCEARGKWREEGRRGTTHARTQVEEVGGVGDGLGQDFLTDIRG